MRVMDTAQDDLGVWPAAESVIEPAAVTGSALADARPEGMTVRGLGPHRLKDLDRTERVYQ